MLDGLYSHLIDPLWIRPAKLLVRLGLTANQVTILGLVLVAANCAAYFWHGSSMALGIGLAVSFAADSLDGAVARLRNEASRFGGYLDAVIDRYQEAVVFFTIAYIHDEWLAAMLALTGAFLTSYTKARTAIEMPISNTEWPDLLERLERVIVVCALLIVHGAVAFLGGPAETVLMAGLWLFAIATHLTALQRCARARQLLTKSPTGGGAEDL